MDLTTWLEAEKGRAAALAVRFDKTPAAISQWKRNGVPLALMKDVRDFTEGAVTLEEMVPGPIPGRKRIGTKGAPRLPMGKAA